MPQDLQLHSLSSSKRFRRKGYAREPVRGDGEGEQQQGGMLKWVVLVGVGAVGLKWWHDKQQLDQANAGSRRVGGTAKGLFGLLGSLFGGKQRSTLRYRGRAGRADAQATATASSSSSQAGAAAEADAAAEPSSSTSGQPGERKKQGSEKGAYDKAKLSHFVDGQWVQLAKDAKVSFSTSEGGLENLVVACSARQLHTPASSELHLHGSASNKQVKFKLDGSLYSLEFPSAAACEAFHEDFSAKVQSNRPLLLQQAHRQQAS